MQGVDQGTWWIGRIQKMTRGVSGNSWGLLKQPVDLANRGETQGKKGVNLANVLVILHYYAKAPGLYKFKYDPTDSKWISLESVITNVMLIYNLNNQVYTLDRGDAENLNEYVSNNIVE